MNLVSFDVRGQRLGCPIAQVKETIVVRPITRVFLTPAWVAGIINLRGDIVAVLDFAVLLGLGPTLPQPETRIVIVRRRAHPGGARRPPHRGAHRRSRWARRAAVDRRPRRRRPPRRRRHLGRRRAARRARPRQALRIGPPPGALPAAVRSPMERRKGFRFPLFWKILVSCLALAGLLIGLSYVYSLYRQSLIEGRGRYLEAYLKRYFNYQEGVGQAVYSVAEILAADATLRASASEKTEGRAREMYQALQTKNALHPGLFLVFDKDAHALYLPENAPVKGDDLKDLEAANRVRNGQRYTNKLVIIDGTVCQADGVPHRTPDTSQAARGFQH